MLAGIALASGQGEAVACGCWGCRTQPSVEPYPVGRRARQTLQQPCLLTLAVGRRARQVLHQL
jgi:hypothetical protein